MCFRERLGMAALQAVAWLGISYAQAADAPEEPIAGSYDILICKGSCATAGDANALVKGRLILFATNLRVEELARQHLSAGRFMRGVPPNGCFGLQKLSGRNYQGYAGIEKVGLTAWSLEGDDLLFALYHSPDAGYKVTVQRAPSGFAGKGKSWGAGVAAPPNGAELDEVVLRRTGAADLSRCPRRD